MTVEGKRKWTTTENFFSNSTIPEHEIEIESLKSRIFDLEDELDKMKNNVRKLNKIVRELEKKKIQH